MSKPDPTSSADSNQKPAHPSPGPEPLPFESRHVPHNPLQAPKKKSEVLSRLNLGLGELRFVRRKPGQQQPPTTSQTPQSQPRPRPLHNVSSPSYEVVKGRYTRFMIAMPILLVTSYYLYDRLALGSERKRLDQPSSLFELGEGEEEK